MHKWYPRLDNLAVPFPGVSWKRKITHVHKGICTKILLLHYYVIAKKKEEKSINMRGTIVWYNQNMRHYTTVAMNKLEIQLPTCKTLQVTENY